MLPRRDEEVYVQEWNSGTTTGRGVGRRRIFPSRPPTLWALLFQQLRGVARVEGVQHPIARGPPGLLAHTKQVAPFYSQKLQNGHPHSFLKIRSVILKQTMDFQNHLNKQKAWKTSSMFPLENNSLELTYGQVPPGPMTPCCIMSSLTPVGIFTGTPEEGPAGPSPTTWFNHFSPVAFHFMPIPRIAHKYPWPQEGPFSNCWVSFQHYFFFLYKKKRH